MLAFSQPKPEPAVAEQIAASIAQGKKLRASGSFAEAIKKYTAAAHLAHESGDLRGEAVALRESSACHLSLFHYRKAIQLAQTSRELALRAKDNTTSGTSAVLLCSIYRLLGDFGLSEAHLEYAIRELADTPQKNYLANALLNQSALFAQEGRYSEAAASAQRAIAVAQQAHLPIFEGMSWDFAGIVLLKSGNVSEAEQSLAKAVAIQTNVHDTDHLAITHEHLAELELKKGNYAAALKFVDQAFAADTPSFGINPQYYPVHVRAEILLGLGRTSEALAELKRAVDSASAWRLGALPGDVTSTFTVAELHEVFHDYAELAATLALKNHDSALARGSLEVLAENRAASLREQLTLSLDKNLRLPPEYFELVSALQKEQANVTLGGKPQEHEAKLRDIRIQLADLENKVGIKNSDNSAGEEKKQHKNSLRGIQSRLGTNEVLLSFCLGTHKSFVWVVTGDDVNVYQLPDQSAIGAQAKAFAVAERTGVDATGAGRLLSRTLFGQVSPSVWQKRDWLITPDGALLDGIPFSAIPAPFDPNAPLSGTHTLRLLPSELLLLQPEAVAPAPVFIGIADPIYNLADPRRQGLPLLQAKQTSTAVNLARLAGGAREIKAAAKLSGISDVELLTGARASGEELRRAVRNRPQVLHFAVHVVSPAARPQEAALALSLTSGGMPELLTPEAIASYRVPGSLVIMSGCDSEQGKTVPSAGLLGLSRAWLLAGAAAVVVSAWPTPDDSGQFFSAFYTHMQKHSGPIVKRASAALQEAQLDMQRGGGYRSAPSFWAAYSIISKE